MFQLTSIFAFNSDIHTMIKEMNWQLNPKLAVLLIILLSAFACVSLRRFFIRRQFARRHGCQPVARSVTKDPFLGLDKLPGAILALRQHKVLEKDCLNFRTYGNTFT